MSSFIAAIVGFIQSILSIFTPAVVPDLPTQMQGEPNAIVRQIIAPTNAESDAKAWETYHNDEYGFTVQYPSDWTVNDGSSTYEGFQNAAVQLLSPVRNMPPYGEAIFAVSMHFYNGKKFFSDMYLYAPKKPYEQSPNFLETNEAKLEVAVPTEYAVAKKILQLATVRGGSSTMLNWESYNHPIESFSLWYPPGTDVREHEISGGKSIDITPPGSTGWLTIEILRGDANGYGTCRLIDPEIDQGTMVLINGVRYLKQGTSIFYRGMHSRSQTAIEHCASNHDITYKIIARNADPETDRIIKEMIANFVPPFTTGRPQ